MTTDRLSQRRQQPTCGGFRVSSSRSFEPPHEIMRIPRLSLQRCLFVLFVIYQFGLSLQQQTLSSDPWVLMPLGQCCELSTLLQKLSLKEKTQLFEWFSSPLFADIVQVVHKIATNQQVNMVFDQIHHGDIAFENTVIHTQHYTMKDANIFQRRIQRFKNLIQGNKPILFLRFNTCSNEFDITEEMFDSFKQDILLLNPNCKFKFLYLSTPELKFEINDSNFIWLNFSIGYDTTELHSIGEVFSSYSNKQVSFQNAGGAVPWPKIEGQYEKLEGCYYNGTASLEMLDGTNLTVPTDLNYRYINKTSFSIIAIRLRAQFFGVCEQVTELTNSQETDSKLLEFCTNDLLMKLSTFLHKACEPWLQPNETAITSSFNLQEEEDDGGNGVIVLENSSNQQALVDGRHQRIIQSIINDDMTPEWSQVTSLYQCEFSGIIDVTMPDHVRGVEVPIITDFVQDRMKLKLGAQLLFRQFLNLCVHDIEVGEVEEEMERRYLIECATHLFRQTDSLLIDGCSFE